MTILRRITMALLAVAMLATGAARAASTTNFSDQWYIENESGWGISVLQQADVLFIDIFVYGPDNQPTWFTGAAFLQGNAPAGHLVFTGDLNRTTGPYYDAPFNSAPVRYTTVGTLTFDADTVNTAKLTYTVGSTTVEKNVTRQLWRYENLGGNYYGGLVYDQTSCTDTTDNGRYEIFGNMTFSHFSDNSVTMSFLITGALFNGAPITIPTGLTFTFSGAYSQSGHLGQVQGKSVITIPGEGTDTASVALFEIERSINGLTGRYFAVDDAGGCRAGGRFGGVRR